MPYQTSISFDGEAPVINWTKSVHKSERDAYGQSHLDRNRRKFAGQNRRIFDYLMAGNELDSSICRTWKPEIWNLNSRCSDLKNKMGFRISKKAHESKGLTVYFMTEEQRDYNQRLMK